MIPIEDFNSMTPEAAELYAEKREFSVCDYTSDELSWLEELSLEVADKLPDDGEWNLEKLKQISVTVAQCLAKNQGRKLSLNGLCELSPELAEALSNYQGILELNGITSMDEKTANVFSSFAGRELHLQGLVEISDATALILSRKSENHLHEAVEQQIKKLVEHTAEIPKSELSKIRKILDEGSLEKVTFALDLLDSLGAGDEDYAKLFTKTRIKKLISGDSLKFNFLAGRLNQFKSALLNFKEAVNVLPPNTLEHMIAELTELSDGAAKILSGLNWNGLNLNGYNAKGGPSTISDDAAKSLSKFDGSLYLNLKEISDKSAESLSKHKGGSLSINALTELSDAAAESLSKHKGDLSLDGVTFLSDAAVKSLSKCKCSLSLSGLTSLSDAAAESLSQFEGFSLELDGLTSISDVAVKSLSQYKGSHLSLSGLVSLSDSAAESLSQYNGDSNEHSGWLSLDGLTSLSDSASESFSKFKGYSLSLNRVKKLSDMQAKSLSKLSNDLTMLGLHELSDIAAQYFAKSTGQLSFSFELNEKVNQYRES